jgi:hypothetical protein
MRLPWKAVQFLELRPSEGQFMDNNMLRSSGNAA